MMMEVRPAEAKDAEAISCLLGQLGHPSTPRHVQLQLGSIPKNGMDALVAVHCGKVVGALVLQITTQFHQEGPLARIIDLCVSDVNRGSGAGRRLFSEAERVARAKGCAKLEVTANNIRSSAHRFYGRNGMEQTHLYFAKTL
jgi:PhnO protein